ncbi:hypothetical protein [Synechococcus sp. CC9311]|uniref:hypothetical protein n=1 Tax=Synechococcus sp. (strain CC9311) TaxID=64471 RepID=UPI0011D0AC92|nr:hypothetical protein [Synechococcus sp. CC9311]
MIVVLIVAYSRRSIIARYLSRQRYEKAAKKAIVAFKQLDQAGGQLAIFNHLVKQGHIIKSKRRVGKFYMIPNFIVNGEKQDIMLRMSDSSEPFWMALFNIYNASIQDNYFTSELLVPDLWSDEFDQLYIHWNNNFHENLVFSELNSVWTEEIA